MNNRIQIRGNIAAHLIGTGTHWVVASAYREGYRNGDPLDHDRVIELTHHFIAGLPRKLAPVDRMSLTVAISTRAAKQLVSGFLESGWEFLDAEVTIPSGVEGESYRVDLLFYSADGDIVADELKFPSYPGSRTKEKSIAQAKAYSAALAAHFGPQFKGVRLMPAGPEERIFVFPNGDVVYGHAYPTVPPTPGEELAFNQTLLMYRGQQYRGERGKGVA